eukprot:94757-Hanusia_phi.AAC.6
MLPAARSTIKFVDENSIEFKKPNREPLAPFRPDLSEQLPMQLCPKNQMPGERTQPKNFTLNNILKVQAKQPAVKND